MTPKHQRLVDDLLWRVHLRTEELITSTGFRFQPGTREQMGELLRESPFGKHLIGIALYAEGHPYAFEGDVRVSTGYVSELLFRDPLLQAPKNKPHIPIKFHQTELGKLLNDALLRFYQEERPGQLMTITQVRELFSVSRQAVHDWIDQGLLYAIYVEGKAHFYRKQVEGLQVSRSRKQDDKKRERLGIQRLSP
jgi:hypothetical protein